MAELAPAWKTGTGTKTDRIAFATPELLSRTESGQVAFRYEAAKVEFLLQAA
jgi:hypothetical protein